MNPWALKVKIIKTKLFLMDILKADMQNISNLKSAACTERQME